MIQDRISQLQSDISLTCARLGRNPEEIALVGVTKFAGEDKISQALDAGLINVGENKVQEAQRKYPALKSKYPDVKLHMIGHLQTNKVKAALEIFDVIQSVDSLKLAQAIQIQAERLNHDVDIFVQVNTSGEEQKFGMTPDEALTLIGQIAELNRSRIKGLMTMAPFIDDEVVIRDCFRTLKIIFDQAKERFVGHPRVDMKHLSMGMTDDYQIAIEEGSNMVRIGRKIFQN
jgi:hypothetical protein